jgi:hypothetical protein
MKFAFEQDDGSVAVAVPATKSHLERVNGPMTDEEYEAFVRSRLVPANAKCVITLPDDWEAPDRSMRNEWRIRDGQVVIE